MVRQAFTFQDIAADCTVETNCYQLDGRSLGAIIHVPQELQSRYPYNASAYAFIQQLREAIFEFGTIEIPNLPINKTNHTVAMRHPKEHSYSDNPYLNRFCQEPHQDTPPYPTAFWLEAPRRFAATWFMSLQGLDAWSDLSRARPSLSTEEKHKLLIPDGLTNGTALLLTQKPGLLLFDNSQHHQLYHARTCNFEAVTQNPGAQEDTPAYAFNEMGLLHYMNTLDSRRGEEDKSDEDLAEVRAFLSQEQRQ